MKDEGTLLFKLGGHRHPNQNLHLFLPSMMKIKTIIKPGSPFVHFTGHRGPRSHLPFIPWTGYIAATQSIMMIITMVMSTSQSMIILRLIMSMNNKQCCSPETPKRLCQTLGRQPSRSERASTTTNLLSATDSSRLKPDNASFSCLPQVHSIFMMTTTSTTVAKMTTTMMVFGRCMQCKQSGCELARTGFSPTPVDW